MARKPTGSCTGVPRKDSTHLQRVGEAEEQRRRDRTARAPPAEDHGGQGDEALAGGDVRAEAADGADGQERAAEAGDEAAHDHVAVAGPQHVDADRVGRLRVLADGPGAQSPAGAEQRDVDDDDQRVHQVDDDVGVEQQRADDRDVGQAAGSGSAARTLGEL